MKKKVRKIVVNNICYYWRYSEKSISNHQYWKARILIFSEVNHLHIECFFKTNRNIFGGCHLNWGFLAEKNGNEVELNFNHPSFIAELITFLLKNKVDVTMQTRYTFEHAVDFLSEMGYTNFKPVWTFHPIAENVSP